MPKSVSSTPGLAKNGRKILNIYQLQETIVSKADDGDASLCISSVSQGIPENAELAHHYFPEGETEDTLAIKDELKRRISTSL